MTTTPRWYAHDPSVRTGQVVGDLLVAAWVFLCLVVGEAVEDAVGALAEPGRRLQDAGTGLAAGLSDAGGRVGDLPLAGDRLREPFDAAAGASRSAADAGGDAAQSVLELAALIGSLVAVVPILYVLARWLPGRLRWVREAQGAERLRGDVDLLALRAAAGAPLVRLARLGPDPVGAWRRGEPGAAQALAALELRRLGLRPTATATASPPAAAR